MYRYPVYFVNAFTRELFGGNPAAVCPLEMWLPDRTLQAIAAQHNLSETTFFVGAGNRYHLRWFTPAKEVDLCGHATLAAVHVLRGRQPETKRFIFDTRSGKLEAKVDDEGRTELNFPAYTGWEEVGPTFLSRLGETGRAVAVKSLGQPDLLIELENEAAVRAAVPVMAELTALPYRGLILTAPGERTDFVSRFFAPAFGVDEDPVCGSAHCLLTPYWAQKLGKTELTALQVSQRGGELFCRLEEDRVAIAGHSRLYAQGDIALRPDDILR
ncbi:MAG: PhzF family phenazine biosynthesis protein [Verrucomicrobiota bacterium JB022]|nr:PhzF family phenazine biosynthesis protein [Verrucomicrobiota bacterium JB022]